MADRHLEDRIVAQRVAIVGVLVARRDRKHPQPKHLLKRVLDPLGLAPVPDARRKPRRQPELLLDTAQQKHAGVRRQLPPSNATLTFLRATDGRSNGRRVSSLMTGVALLNRFVKLSRNQNHESNCGFPLHPSLISPIG